MSKLGRVGGKISIDVTKIDKARFFKADNGSIWLDAAVFFDLDEFLGGDKASAINQFRSQEEKDRREDPPHIGWFKLLWVEKQNTPDAPTDNSTTPDDDNIPF